MSLIDRAEEQYRLLADEEERKKLMQRPPLDAEFDFLTSEDFTPNIIPVHEVEALREERCRKGHTDRDTSKEEFAAALGIDFDDTRDPDNGHSVLEVTDAIRSYFGDPEDEAYRCFRLHMMQLGNDAAFYKESTFLSSGIDEERVHLQRAEQFLAKLALEQGTSVRAIRGSGGRAATENDAADNSQDARGARAAQLSAARELTEDQYGTAHRDSMRRYRTTHGTGNSASWSGLRRSPAPAEPSARTPQGSGGSPTGSGQIRLSKYSSANV